MIEPNRISDWNENGYVVIPNYFDDNWCRTASSLYSPLNMSVDYFDSGNRPRRSEHFILDEKFGRLISYSSLQLISCVTGINDWVLLKDKLNFKPPGGEGFRAHYDGIFEFKDNFGKIKSGWYEYSSEFINVLIAIDDMTIENGCIELAKVKRSTFDQLIADTNRDGTPFLKRKIEDEVKFKFVEVAAGSVVLFDNRCAHRSARNMSSGGRRSLYLTYCVGSDRSIYNAYFRDKSGSNSGTDGGLR